MIKQRFMTTRIIGTVAIGALAFAFADIAVGSAIASLEGKSVLVAHLPRLSYPNFTRLQAGCPYGSVLTGGREEALGSNSVLNASIANHAHTGWIAVGHQPGHQSVGLHVFADCVSMRDDVLTVKVTRGIRSAYPNLTWLEAQCAGGYRLTGGGAEALGSNSVLNASIPNDAHTGWIAVGH